MKFRSVCSGIEAASVAWNPIGWEADGFSEIEPFPCAVLDHHYPTVTNLGDMTRFMEWPDANFDVLCGGTPCQSFSVAGLRKGLDDPRGNLMLTFGGIAGRYRPRWLVWENVAGVLSSNGGRDFGTFLGLLGILGYGFAYRIFDAQYAGVPQRRRRVFVVGYLGDWRPAAAVLFERHSLQGHNPPSRTAGKDVISILEAGARTGKSTDDPRFGIGISQPGDPMFTLQAGKQHAVLVAKGGSGYMDPTPETFIAIGINGGDTGYSLRANPSHSGDKGDVGVNTTLAITFTLQANHSHAISTGAMVRRLTPTECERLQGFPDGYTAIPYRGKPAADGPRYKALGNSWAVPCARWIGERIQLFEDAIAPQSSQAGAIPPGLGRSCTPRAAPASLTTLSDYPFVIP